MPIKNDPEVFAKERKVLELRQMGITFDVIAQEVGYASAGSCYNAFKRALMRTLQEPADEIRDLASARLDRLLSAVWAKALRGDIPAITASLKILERQAKLMGLDAPTKHQVESTVYDGQSIDAEVDRLRLILSAHSDKPLSVDGSTGEVGTDSDGR
jgi:hypothetical protein